MTIVGFDSGGAYMTAQDALELFLEGANEGTGIFYDLLTEVADNGITDELIENINNWLGLRPRNVIPQLSPKDKSLCWVFDESFDLHWLIDPSGLIYPSAKAPPDQILAFVGWCAALLVTKGVFDDLKRCTVCDNFYIGGPRAKYCSDACGSLNRVRRKRKKDRQRQML